MHPVLEEIARDHRLTVRVVVLIDRCVERLGRGDPVPAALLAGVVDFLDGFVDAYHDRKEETFLFPAMALRPDVHHGFPVPDLVADHRRVHDYLDDVRQMVHALQDGHPGAERRAAIVLGNYGALLRQHLAQEEHVLLPMAQRQLRPEQFQRAAEGFAALREAHGDPAGRYEALVERLEASI
jgi:hemerythrin-like domain-containing protein